MSEIKGGIGVEVDHIFPVIKKWLYSEKEIFLREIVSNACDAVTKLRRLISLGEDGARDIPDEGFKVSVELDKAARTITVTDNGIGMTEEEVQKYICQIARRQRCGLRYYRTFRPRILLCFHGKLQSRCHYPLLQRRARR